MAFQRNQEQQEQEKNLENSYLGPEPEVQQQQQQQQQMNSGLARYRSAPSSYFSTFLDAAASNVNSSSSRGGDYSVDDLDNFLDGLLMPSNEIISVQEHGSSSNNRFSSSTRMNINETHFVASKHVQDCYNRRTIFQPQDHHQQQFNDHVDDSYRFLSSMDKGVTNSNLIRYNSSPAGLFSGLNIVNDGNNQPSGLMSPLPEIADRSIGERDPFSTAFVTENEDNEVFENGAATAAAAMFQLPCTSAMLSRHLSMPTTSTELYGVETLMQDSVLCKFRAKRGCATHPRSIAERVRRTRISERMRKLQQLVPNMEKQSNTSDMLDLAVDYIKALQKQVKTLSEKRSQCTCSKHL